LGDLSAEQRRILGFGNKRNYVHAFVRNQRYPKLRKTFQAIFNAQVFLDAFSERVRTRIRHFSARS